MIRLLYISTARSEMTSAALDALLNHSRVRNAADQITGLLIVGGRRFLQVLEGPEDAVTTTYERICADPRHFAAVTLSNKMVDQRIFPQWSMGYRKSCSTGSYADASVILDTLVDPISDPTIKAYFEQFALKHLAA